MVAVEALFIAMNKAFTDYILSSLRDLKARNAALLKRLAADFKAEFGVAANRESAISSRDHAFWWLHQLSEERMERTKHLHFDQRRRRRRY